MAKAAYVGGGSVVYLRTHVGEVQSGRPTLCPTMLLRLLRRKLGGITTLYCGDDLYMIYLSGELAVTSISESRHNESDTV